MDILKEVIGIYIERKDWFLELLGQHVVLSLIAIMLAGTIGLLIGVFISEHDRLAPVVLGIANVFYTIPSISLFGILIPIMGIGDKQQ